MNSPIRLDILGIIDIISAILLIYTQSPIPTSIAQIHASILLIKGIGGIIKPIQMPYPVFIIGGMADVLSAAILIVGQPPILVEYKNFITGILLFKGFWSLFALMQKR